LPSHLGSGARNPVQLRPMLPVPRLSTARCSAPASPDGTSPPTYWPSASCSTSSCAIAPTFETGERGEISSCRESP
jgi:hypothetical protein